MTNYKNTEDLFNEHECGWFIEPNLDELLLDYDAMMEESFNRLAQIVRGDIIMANNGVSDRELGLDILTPHRIFIVENATGKTGDRIFRGYLISSVKEKANYYNKKFPQNIYINNYSTIIDRGAKYNSENFINMADLYIIDESKISKDSTLWKGHANSEFISFIDKVRAMIDNRKDTSKIYWIKEQK